MKFTRLTVIERVENTVTKGGNHRVMWKCICDCGVEKIVTSGSLLSGGTKSCGCYSRDLASKRMRTIQRKYNNYDLSGEYGIGYTFKGDEFYFDLEDYDKIKDYCWCKHHTGYFMAKIIGTKKHITIHKIIMNCLNNEYLIDHKNGNKNDNRKENLRKADRSKNVINRTVVNNTSGCVGVYWKKSSQSWEAVIGINRKKYYLGRYKDFNEAVKVRKEAEEKYFGEWSYDNSRKKENENGKKVW